MEIHFLRHGIAEDAAPTDAERRLTAEGREKCQLAARGLEALGARFTHVWSSPLVRARETAELCWPETQAEVRDVLASPSPNELLAELRELPARAVVLLVGHEPQLSLTVERLLGVGPGGGQVAMKKAGLAVVEVALQDWPRTTALLVSLLTPKQLRQLGGAD